MEKFSDIFVSVVFVVDGIANDVEGSIKEITKILSSNYTNYEVLIIDNGINNNELNSLKKLLPIVPCLRLIRLSKSHDTDTAVFAGVEAAIGDYICTLYNGDPPKLINDFVSKAKEHDIVFGVAKNLKRRNQLQDLGARIFYWYSRKYLKIDIPDGSTYYICMNRSAANALTRSGRYMRHIRHMSKQVGFNSTNVIYELPEDFRKYSNTKTSNLITKAIDLGSNYSSHPLRVLTYFGIFAGVLNIIYACYVVIINFSQNDVAKGWTSLSLQSSIMFFILFIILGVLAEYIGKILNESQHEPPYHIMQELSSTTSIADETRRNVTQ